jgi:hypothetical protein
MLKPATFVAGRRGHTFSKPLPTAHHTSCDGKSKDNVPAEIPLHPSWLAWVALPRRGLWRIDENSLGQTGLEVVKQARYHT